jgi:FtsH-binding integral membrane protein
MAFAQAARRPIEGAVATLGVSDRVAFLKRTYAHLGIALVLWAGLTAAIFRYATSFSIKFSSWALGGGTGSRLNWLLVILAFMGVKMLARHLAMSDTSKGAQYFALFLSPLAEAVILQPLIWLCFMRFAHTDTNPMTVIGEAALITLTIFVGLTLTVMWTKKDFSFLSGILSLGFWAALGIIIASVLFGFNLGMLFCGFMVVLLAGYILYETSLVMAYFPPNKHIGAALMLYSSIATLFWYILQMLMSSRRN